MKDTQKGGKEFMKSSFSLFPINTDYTFYGQISGNMQNFFPIKKMKCFPTLTVNSAAHCDGWVGLTHDQMRNGVYCNRIATYPTAEDVSVVATLEKKSRDIV